MRRGDICAVFSLLVSCAAFVGPPKCACRGRALRASVPQPGDDDPITKELTGLVTRAEITVGFAELRSAIEVAAESQRSAIKVAAESQRSDVRSLATELRSEVRVGVESQQIASTAFFFSLLLLGVLGYVGYADLSDKVTKLAPEVAKIDKVATEFDLYKNGANAILAALAGATIGAAITATFTYLKNLQQTKEP
mmetsp:Transcript_19183/g.61709  ORF Transcript_19183/g.61709 Transcript_19183/m.61709 type:complete len:195 (-) Transcript_19183:387-971(-)